jgi:hypothetical protein|tara:strand:- start:1455 stop:1868 length:414 start_codon:yes stop_codon:yes gene_type:complete
MITYANIINNIIGKVANIIGDEVSIPITFDEHKGNHSILIVPQEDNLLDLFAQGQSREYSILISYELTTGGNMSENTFKQLSNTAEHIKRLFAPDNNATVTDYWFGGRVESVTYERPEDESKILALITFTCTYMEAS